MQNEYAVMFLVGTLRYTPESRVFDSRWGVFIDFIVPASNSNEYRGYSWGVRTADA
jgi:hypothetical protein